MCAWIRGHVSQGTVTSILGCHCCTQARSGKDSRSLRTLWYTSQVTIHQIEVLHLHILRAPLPSSSRESWRCRYTNRRGGWCEIHSTRSSDTMSVARGECGPGYCHSMAAEAHNPPHTARHRKRKGSQRPHRAVPGSQPFTQSLVQAPSALLLR